MIFSSFELIVKKKLKSKVFGIYSETYDLDDGLREISRCRQVVNLMLF